MPHHVCKLQNARLLPLIIAVDHPQSAYSLSTPTPHGTTNHRRAPAYGLHRHGDKTGKPIVSCAHARTHPSRGRGGVWKIRAMSGTGESLFLSPGSQSHRGFPSALDSPAYPCPHSESDLGRRCLGVICNDN